MGSFPETYIDPEKVQREDLIGGGGGAGAGGRGRKRVKWNVNNMHGFRTFPFIISKIFLYYFQVTFEGKAGSSYTGDLAIDDVSISNGSCLGQTTEPPTYPTNVSLPTSSPAVASCDFDYSLCFGWQQSYSNVFNWTRHSGSTPSIDTGPSADHTTGYGKLFFVQFLA